MNLPEISKIVYFIILLLLAFREGIQERYTHIEQDPDKKRKLSKWWHALGGFARIMLAGLSWIMWHNWIILAAALFIISIGYNIVINVYKKHKWWYIGTTADTDKVIRKVFWFVDFDKAL